MNASTVMREGLYGELAGRRRNGGRQDRKTKRLPPDPPSPKFGEGQKDLKLHDQKRPSGNSVRVLVFVHA
jgi:hypothetical protein